MNKYVVIDDEENEDTELGVHRWIVTSDETGEDYDAEIARFRNEKDADKYAASLNSE